MQNKVPSTEKTAIVVAAFGTTYPSAVDALLAIVRDIEARYPQIPVQMAFTSNIIRKKWHSRASDNEYRSAHPEVPTYFYRIKNVLGTLADLQDQGYKTIVVQPTLLTDGEEYSDLQSYINGLLSIKTVKSRWQPFNKIALGRPLMGSQESGHSVRDDLRMLANALSEDIERARKKQANLLYVGHGNEHLSNSIYSDFQQVMIETYPEVKTLIGLVEGHPDQEDVLTQLTSSTQKRTLLKPLMVVAGDHARNDMAGEDEDSWSSRLNSAGYESQPIFEGLGDKKSVRDIFLKHLQDAATESGIELR